MPLLVPKLRMHVAMHQLPQYLNDMHQDKFRFTCYPFIFAAPCPRHGFPGTTILAGTRTRRSEHISTALPCPLQFVHVLWLLKAQPQNLSVHPDQILCYVYSLSLTLLLARTGSVSPQLAMFEVSQRCDRRRPRLSVCKR